MLRKLCSVTGPKISDFSGAALQCPTARQVHCSGWGVGERLFKAGRLLAFIAYRVGAYPVFEVSAYSNKYGTSQVQNKRGKTFIFCDFEDPPPPPQRIQRSSYTYHRLLVFRYWKRLRNILEIPMLSEVNKMFKDNPIFFSFLLSVLFPPNPVYFDPPFNNFSKSSKYTRLILAPPLRFLWTSEH